MSTLEKVGIFSAIAATYLVVVIAGLKIGVPMFVITLSFFLFLLGCVCFGSGD